MGLVHLTLNRHPMPWQHLGLRLMLSWQQWGVRLMPWQQWGLPLLSWQPRGVRLMPWRQWGVRLVQPVAYLRLCGYSAGCKRRCGVCVAPPPPLLLLRGGVRWCAAGWLLLAHGRWPCRRCTDVSHLCRHAGGRRVNMTSKLLWYLQCYICVLRPTIFVTELIAATSD